MRKLRVLMLSTDPRVLGGMTSMAQMTMAYAQQTEFRFMAVGSLRDQAGGQRHEGFFARFWRLLVVPIHIARAAKTVDVVHLNTPFNRKGLLRDSVILLALRLRGIRHVLLYFHGWQPDVAERIQASRLLRWYFRWLLRDVPQIMVLAQGFKTTLIALGIDAECIAVTRTMFDGQYLRLPSLQDAPPANGRRRILFLSRFVRQKGIYVLLKAFARIAGDHADVDLVLAGDGPEYDAVLRTARSLTCADRITFTGYVGGAEKAALLMGCTLVALPTFFPEGLPVVLLEAMAAGKPLLTSHTGGIAEVISQPEHGILLHEVRVDTVEAALRQLLSDPDYCHACGARNAAYAWARFEASAVTKEIEAVYRAIAIR